MNKQQVMKELEALGHEKVRKQNAKAGAGDNQFGVKRGDLRKVAKKIKNGHELALELWDTGNIDAQFVAALLLKPKKLSAKEVKNLVASTSFTQVADWLMSYVVKNHTEKEALRQEWMKSKDPMSARAGWALTAGRVAREPEGLDIPALLDRIESEMADAAPEAQWTMNNTLAGIGIHHAKFRKRATAIGESLGIYRDYPVSKGCTSPFAPIWIDAMVARQG